MTPTTRLDVAPLIAWIRHTQNIDIHPNTSHDNSPNGAATLTALAHHIGVTRRRLHQARKRGLSITQADRLCTQLGTHLLLIWPHAYNDINTQEEAA